MPYLGGFSMGTFWQVFVTLKMHFSASSQWSKIYIGYQEITFNGKKVLKFSQIVLVRLGGGDPPHPQSGQPDRFFPVFFLTLPLQTRSSHLLSTNKRKGSLSPSQPEYWDEWILDIEIAFHLRLFRRLPPSPLKHLVVSRFPRTIVTILQNKCILNLYV